MKWKSLSHRNAFGGKNLCEKPVSDTEDYVMYLGDGVTEDYIQLVIAAGGRLKRSICYCGIDSSEQYAIFNRKEAEERGILCPRCGRPEPRTDVLQKYGVCERHKPWRKYSHPILFDPRYHPVEIADGVTAIENVDTEKLVKQYSLYTYERRGWYGLRDDDFEEVEDE